MRRARLIARLLLCLILGAATTIALAWAFACTDTTVSAGQDSIQRILPTRGPVRSPGMMEGFAGSVSARVFVSRTRAIAMTRCYGPEFPDFPGLSAATRGSDLPPDRLVPASIRTLALPWLYDYPWPRGSDLDWREIQASGWPLISMANEYRLAPNFTYEHRFGIALPWKPQPMAFSGPYGTATTSTLPLLPLWPNFALDTLFFALAWLPLIFLPGALRRALRRHRGQCPNCADDLSATPATSPCPECGRKPHP